MMMISHSNTEFLHDATVCEIAITIGDNGERRLRIRVHCDANSGNDQYNDQILDLVFHDPVIVIGELFGHMANKESFDSWNQGASTVMSNRIETLREAGLEVPQQVTELVFHSGSTIEVAHQRVEIIPV